MRATRAAGPHPGPGPRPPARRPPSALGRGVRCLGSGSPLPPPPLRAPRPPARRAAVAGSLLPGPGSGVRKSLQATQPRTSGSKHWEFAHCVGAGPLRPRRPRARPMLPAARPAGTEPPGLPEGGNGGRQSRPAPPSRLLGWDHSSRAPGPCTPGRATCGSSIQALNHHPGWCPLARPLRDWDEGPAASTRAPKAPDGHRHPPAAAPHLPPPLGSPPAFPRQSRLRSPITARGPTWAVPPGTSTLPCDGTGAGHHHGGCRRA